MSRTFIKAVITVDGVVQGVGFRYFVQRHALALGVKGYVKNLPSGKVLTIAEGEKYAVDGLINLLKVGPKYSTISSCNVEIEEYKNEFKNFEIRF